MSGWDFRRILPNHGAPEVIESGGYDRRFIDATRRYVEKLLRCKRETRIGCGRTSRASLAEALASGATRYFAPYEAVHRRNVDAVTGRSGA